MDDNYNSKVSENWKKFLNNKNKSNATFEKNYLNQSLTVIANVNSVVAQQLIY